MDGIIVSGLTHRATGRGYLSSDHLSTATGLDPAFMISKNGGNFANPAAGASVMTEIEATGWYYFALAAGDTDTVGPLICRGTHATMDNIEVVFQVVSVTRGLSGTALPAAAAGADGGLTICGSNAAATFASLTCTGALTVSDGLIVSASTAGREGAKFTGNTTGAGILATGGATGNGMTLNAGATSGHGLSTTAIGTSYNGINAVGSSTSGNGIKATGGGTGHGIWANSGSGATGQGICAISSASTGGNGIYAQGNLAGAGFSLVGGASGNGIKVTTTAGDGILVTPTGGNALTLTGNGTSKHGLFATGGTAGTSDGIYAVAGSEGVPIRGNITGNITGTVTTATNLTNAPPDSAGVTALLADVGDASGSTLGSLYAILGNAAATLTSRIPAALDGGNMPAQVKGQDNISFGALQTAGILAQCLAALDTAYTDADSPTANGIRERLRILGWILRNKLEVTNATGTAILYKDNSTTVAFTVVGLLLDDSTTTTRLRVA